MLMSTLHALAGGLIAQNPDRLAELVCQFDRFVGDQIESR
jgi:hypothetical protein